MPGLDLAAIHHLSTQSLLPLCLLASTVRCLHSHGSASKYHARHENERALRLQRLVQIIEYIHGMLIC